MGMTITRRKDAATPRYFMHKVADIRGGVSVAASELGSSYLPEGAVVSKPENGICHVVKVGVLYATAGASDTALKVKKYHNFGVGDFVMAKENGAAVKITAIDTSNKDYDPLTVDKALGAVSAGGAVAQAAAAAETNTSALKYEPFAIVGTGKAMIAGGNIDTDAWVIGVTKGLTLPDYVWTKLKGIVNY